MIVLYRASQVLILITTYHRARIQIMTSRQGRIQITISHPARIPITTCLVAPVDRLIQGLVSDDLTGLVTSCQGRLGILGTVLRVLVPQIDPMPGCRFSQGILAIVHQEVEHLRAQIRDCLVHQFILVIVLLELARRQLPELRCRRRRNPNLAIRGFPRTKGEAFRNLEKKSAGSFLPAFFVMHKTNPRSDTSLKVPLCIAASSKTH
ncbi:MAG: hypothetical protein WBW33_16740 [Bryobacteraceae bacterium]